MNEGKGFNLFPFSFKNAIYSNPHSITAVKLSDLIDNCWAKLLSDEISEMRNMSKGKNIHVVPRNKRWVVRKENSSRPSSIHNTQREAIEKGREAARNHNTELIIHRSDGRVGFRDSYSNDPLPPKEHREVLFPENLSSTGKKAIRNAVDAVVRKPHKSSRVLGTSRRGWQHVVPHESGWAVRGEGNSRATSVHNTQREAIEAAREIARNQNGVLLIHGRNGQIRERDATGSNDTHPPKG